jgi:hypothetical protein
LNTKGQSLLEWVMILPLFLAFWAAAFWTSQYFILRLQLLLTARHGILRITTSDSRRALSKVSIADECKRYLHSQAPRIESNRVHVRITPGDTWRPFGPRHLADIQGIPEMLKSLGTSWRSSAGLRTPVPATVTVEVDLPSPPILKAVPGFPKTLRLRGYCAGYR